MRRSLLFGLLIFFTGQFTLSAQTRLDDCGKGTNIYIQSGTLEPGACSDDPENSLVKFRAVPFFTTYAVVVTDDDLNIIAITRNRVVDFSTLPAGKYRVYGLFYSGLLSAKPGMNAGTDQLATRCYGLTDNFVEIKAVAPEGGLVSNAAGLSAQTICDNDPTVSQVVDFATTSESDNYQYIITDNQDIIQAFPVGDNFDFSTIDLAESRVYGLAYNSTFTLNIGDTLRQDVSLTDECAEISDNFLVVIKENPIGGNLSFSDGSESTFACKDEDNLFMIQLDELGNTPYVYIITSRNGIVTDFTSDPNIDFSVFPANRYRIYGAAFTGNLQLEIGDDILGTTISDGCYDLSENFLSINIPNLETSNFALADGGLEATLCRNVLVPATLTFTNSALNNQNKVYLITDSDDTVVDIVLNATIDFSNYDQADLRVYCLAYTGNLLLQAGDQLGSIVYSSECAELSSQFVKVRQEFLDSGSVLLEDNSTEALICLEADQGKVFRFDLSDLAGGQRALIVTDQAGNIVDITESDSIIINPELPGSFLVYGLVYTGNLKANLGNNINNNQLSDACFELSINTVEFNTISVEGGMVQLDNGATSVEVCVMDGMPDFLTFDAVGINPANEYRFVLTDVNDNIILPLSGNLLDFDVATMGTTRIYGVSYAGEWTAPNGQDILNSPLSDLCYDVSDNFIEIKQLDINAGTISFEDGSDLKTLCSGVDNAPVAFQQNDTQSPSYTYFLTNTANEVLAITGVESAFQFGLLNLDTIRVWGAAYSGTLNFAVVPGTPLEAVVISDACFAFSDNYITLIQTLPVAGELSFADGGTQTTFCSQETNRTVSYTTNGQSAQNYAYLVTDQLNIIQEVTTQDTFNFSAYELGDYRIWGLAYSGNLTAKAGDHAPETSLSDECFDLSATALEVSIEALDGGSLVLSNGETEYYICSQLDEVVINMADNQATGDNFIYLLVAPDQQILSISDNSQFNLSEINSNEFTVRGLSYNGNLLIQVGATFAEDLVFSSQCYDLSDNSIFVAITIPESSELSLANNQDEVQINCNLDDQVIEILGTPENNYVYFVADDNDLILSIQDSSNIDFSTFQNGDYQIFGATYSGELSLQIGQNAINAKISNACFKRAENTISVQKNNTVAGTISALDGSDTIAACTENDQANISVQVTNNLGLNYNYLITDLNGLIKEVKTSESFTVDFSGTDSLLVYGISFAGNLSIVPGTTTINDNLSDDCFELTATTVNLIRTMPAGGQISLVDQSNSLVLCPEDLSPVDFVATGNSASGSYLYLLTSEDNEFLRAFSSSSIDFTGLDLGTYHVWGLVSLGALIIQPGDDVTNSQLSNDCFSLTSNFVNVSKIQPLGGLISTLDGEEAVYACPGQGNSKVVEFETVDTKGTGDLAYILADSSDIVLAVLQNPILDLDTLALGNYAVYSLTYNGDLDVVPGDTIGSSSMATSCHALSQNKVALVIENPVGGTISGNGISGNKICISNTETQLSLSVSGQSLNTAYTYLITNDQDGFLFAIDGEIDLDFFFQGDLKVWGLAYTGELTIDVFDDVKDVALSDDCYDLSTNVLTIVKEDIDGGTVATLQGQTAAYACPGDGNPDIVQLSNTSSSGTANYAYIVTTVGNNIFTALSGNERNFDNIGAFKELRIWGVSYTGTLNTPVFADLFATKLSDGCFDISDNFVRIFRDQPDAGSINTSIGDIAINLCPGATPDTILLSNTSSTLAGYAYILVDENTGQITQIIQNAALAIRSVDIGTYQLFGLSYTGNITAQVGDPFSTEMDFSDNCHELSSAAINLTRGGEVDGGMLSTPDGESLYYTCPFDQMGDLIIVDAPVAIPGTEYRIVITDTDNSILFPDIQGGIIPFDGAMPGEYRIWGISFTGDYRGQFGLDVLSDPLSTGCYTTSDNFITVISVNPEAGQISTIDGQDAVQLSTDSDPIVTMQTTANDDAPYRYLLTDTAGVIKQITDTDQIDFSRSTDGNYLIYGLNFTGTFLASVGDTISTATLASNCYSLSENVVTVQVELGNIDPNARAAEVNLGKTLAEDFSINIYPNPVQDRMNIKFEWKATQELAALISVIDRSGRVILQKRIPTEVGLNVYQLDLSSLPNGLFMIQLQGGHYLGKQRFIKTQ